jgi:hypothetical protein
LAEGAIGGETPGIFISYRREDAPGHAGRLYDALAARFGEEQVFMDLSMEPGVDFIEQIDAAVGSCRLLVAVVGRAGRRSTTLADSADSTTRRTSSESRSRPGSGRATCAWYRCSSKGRRCRAPTSCRHRSLSSPGATRSS